jgi:hypothetical protein
VLERLPVTDTLRCLCLLADRLAASVGGGLSILGRAGCDHVRQLGHRNGLAFRRDFQALQDAVAQEEAVQLLRDRFGVGDRIGTGIIGKDENETALATHHDIVRPEPFLDEVRRGTVDLVAQAVPLFGGFGANQIEIDPLEMPDIDRSTPGERGLQAFHRFNIHGGDLSCGSPKARKSGTETSRC